MRRSSARASAGAIQSIPLHGLALIPFAGHHLRALHGVPAEDVFSTMDGTTKKTKKCQALTKETDRRPRTNAQIGTGLQRRPAADDHPNHPWIQYHPEPTSKLRPEWRQSMDGYAETATVPIVADDRRALSCFCASHSELSRMGRLRRGRLMRSPRLPRLVSEGIRPNVLAFRQQQPPPWRILRGLRMRSLPFRLRRR